MGIPDGAHTHGGGGSDILALIAGAVLLVVVAPAVIAIVHVLLIAVAVILAAVVAIGVPAAFLLARMHRRHIAAVTAGQVEALRRREAQLARQLAQARKQVTAGGQHLHFHGTSPEDIAAIIARQPVKGSLEDQ